MAKHAPSKEISQLLRQARLNGYGWERLRSGHLLILNGDGSPVILGGRRLIIAGSPGSGAAIRTAIARLRRAGVLERSAGC